jgi:hypothetical protein
LRRSPSLVLSFGKCLMSMWIKPRSYSLKVPFPLPGFEETGVGRRWSPSAFKMRQMLSRLRLGRKCVTTKVRSSSAKLVIRRNAQTTARSSSVAFQGKLVRARGVIETVLDTTLTPLPDRFRADPVALGQNSGALFRASDLGADRRGCTGVWVNGQHRLFLSGRQGQQALKPVTIVYNRLPDWIPTMFRNQTARAHCRLV